MPRCCSFFVVYPLLVVSAPAKTRSPEEPDEIQSPPPAKTRSSEMTNKI